MKREDMITKLRVHIYTNFKSAKEYADHKGVSSQYVSAVMRGVKDPSDEILLDINLVKKVTKTVEFVAK